MKMRGIKVNSKAVEGGEWVKNLPEMEDLELLARGQNCAAWRELQQKLINQLPRHMRNRPNGLPTKIMDGIINKCLVGAGILGWKNMELDAGDTPFDSKLLESLLDDPDWQIFREACIAATNRVGTANAEADEALAGNSGTSSSGSSATEGAQTG